MTFEYLCYDIRAIQSFIFRVPRLRYIVGGSALVDRFDRRIAPTLAEKAGVDHVFSAGGKGAFLAKRAKLESLREALLREAHACGFDIRFGSDASFSEAAHTADELYPYLPPGSQLDGHPCAMSGLYPVEGHEVGDVHPAIRERVEAERRQLGRWFEDRILRSSEATVRLPPPLEIDRCMFFRNVDPRDAFDDERGEVRAAVAALGKRNRWAVVCMDGNDMGSQFREASARFEPPLLVRWLKRHAAAVDACALRACRDGMAAAIEKWSAQMGAVGDATIRMGRGGKPTVVLPMRPLVVGGDDIVVLIHASFAFEFVRAAIAAFADEAARAASAARRDGIDLFPATGGKISISAGILFTPIGLPLHTAIPYAESLLASAKGKGRAQRRDGEPAPACVDWEQVTEGLLDHPAARRARELRFKDGDAEGATVALTRRPYTVEELGDLQRLAEQYRKIPATIRHQVLPGMRAGLRDRQVFLARLGKRHGELVKHLQDGEPGQPPPRGSRWRVDGGDRERSTDVIDALLLLEESARMRWETANA